MRGALLRRLGPTSRYRVLADLLWLGAFAAVLGVMLLGGAAGRGGTTGVVALELVQGAQRQALLRRGERIGTVAWRVARTESGWAVDHRLQIGAAQAARFRLGLRKDLSLASLDLRADLRSLAGVFNTPAWIAGQLGDLREIEVQGRCSSETGACALSGALGRHPVNTTVQAGRGPVVTSAIYPLLARGTLGREAELSVFDPLTLNQRSITFRIEGEESLELPSGTFRTIRVHRDLGGLDTRVWLDPEGRVLKEELPLGFVVVHEAWSDE